MKKIVLFVLFCVTMCTSVLATNIQSESSVEANRGTAVEILVEANAAVDELCNYFNDSWLNAGLSLYCSIGGDVYTCTAYKIVKGACAVNGAIKLYIEGDFSGALKKALTSAGQIYAITKIGNSFKMSQIKPAANMTPINGRY